MTAETIVVIAACLLCSGPGVVYLLIKWFWHK